MESLLLKNMHFQKGHQEKIHLTEMSLMHTVRKKERHTHQLTQNRVILKDQSQLQMTIDAAEIKILKIKNRENTGTIIPQNRRIKIVRHLQTIADVPEIRNLTLQNREISGKIIPQNHLTRKIKPFQTITEEVEIIKLTLKIHETIGKIILQKLLTGKIKLLKKQLRLIPQ